jgi:class 3 adenylate cyclase
MESVPRDQNLRAFEVDRYTDKNMKCNKAIGLLFMLFSSSVGICQDRTADSLEQILHVAKDDTSRVRSLIQLSSYYLNSSTEKAKQYALQALDLAQKIDYAPGRALALKNIGIAYFFQGNTPATLEYYGQSLHVYDSIGDLESKARMLSNFGTVYYTNGSDDKALESYFNSLDIAEKISDKGGIATAYSNIANVYLNKRATTGKALGFFLKALLISEGIGDNVILGAASFNLGEIYRNLNKEDSALFYYYESVKAYTNTIDMPVPLRGIGLVYAKRGDFENAIRYDQESYQMARKFDSKLYMAQALIALAGIHLKMAEYPVALSYYKLADSVARSIPAYKELDSAYAGMATTYAKLGDYNRAFIYQKHFSSLTDTINNQTLADKLAGLQRNFEIQSRQNQINLLTKDSAIQELDIRRQKIQKAFITAALILIFIIAFVIYRNYRSKVKTNKVLDTQKAEIEGLLLNILPSEVAAELQQNGIATPRFYEQVSVLFTDFKGFTLIADALSPQQVVSELNACFMAFDDIIEKYHLEKIKTIGDSYMCAGGIPTENDSHPVNMVRAALEIRDWMKSFNDERIRLHQHAWELRIGIHVGPVVAGVVGKKKYAYDIWGSTVNIASRIESSGLPGMVNISEATYKLVRDKFNCFYRGKISAKNIGDIDMYFVEKEASPSPTPPVLPLSIEPLIHSREHPAVFPGG